MTEPPGTDAILLGLVLAAIGAAMVGVALLAWFGWQGVVAYGGVLLVGLGRQLARG